MEEVSQPPPERKKPKSDIIRTASVEEYLQAHAKPNGQGWRGFFHSNLFVALLLWTLSQAVVMGGVFISYYIRTAQLAEWKGSVDSQIKQMNDFGTTHGHFNDEREDRDIADLQARVKVMENEGRHWEVIESEHRRLTRDVEELRTPKK